ncbi:DUF982 domain-containing protein [Sinorhizobium meliloti]|uniref:DUF982 domain-containing protein n=1 Tax=Rhizobium meliloti TaxID=382 RepID=UPI000B4A36A4|nr:DUF982 domain-containing protein [Sinorhizobium meliloti]ASP86730.1 DUF982 domain-containing protein [Sinorhizobium meliloti]ASP93468.1 DUF982 domain-containing protein [Sinorhizobium meliloti]MQW26511.1 DUF982 domain-containing protein [Sinorhizobium meliloti]MQX58124.1 DUF982 domain-containing protein [Sinorhizobium meliloti]RVJ68652.1 DUF982 domain-containing protein [Sinorhizobium meliloti]
MKEIPWRVPLSVRLQNGIERRFCGPYDALDFLEHEWPNHGRRFHRAVRDCRAALSSLQTAEVARRSFIDACIEASMPFAEARRDHTPVSMKSASVRRRH